MSNSSNSCIYPLVETKHPPFVRILGTSCGAVCKDPLDVQLFFTIEEEERLKRILLMISLLVICLSLFYLFIALAEWFRKESSFYAIGFSHQCPIFISCGYLLVAVISICPYIFGAASIICNNDEQTLIINSILNIPCSLTAIGIYIGIRLAVFYTCALSVSVVLTLYYPKLVQKKLYYHGVVWTCILIGMIAILLKKSISGDYWLGVCTTTLNSRSDLLWMNIIPMSGCVILFSFCLTMAAVKLLRPSSKRVSRMLAVNREMRSLFNRLILYNLLQTVPLASSVGNFFYWYLNLEIWKDTALAIAQCEINKTIMRETSLHDYEMCVKDNSHLPKPPGWIYWFFHLCALVSVLGAIVFQCSIRVQQRSLTAAKVICTDMMAVVAKRMSTSSTETTARSQKYEWKKTTRNTVNKEEIMQSEPELIWCGNDANSFTVLSRLETEII